MNLFSTKLQISRVASTTDHSVLSNIFKLAILTRHIYIQLSATYGALSHQ